MVLESGGLITVKINLDLLNCPICGTWQHYFKSYPEQGVTVYRCKQCRTAYTTTDFIRFERYDRPTKRPPNPKTQKRIRTGKTRNIPTLPEMGKREYGPDKAVEVYTDENDVIRIMKVLSENDNKIVDSYIQTQGYITVYEFASEKDISVDRARLLLEHEVMTGRLASTTNINSMGGILISPYRAKLKLYFRDPEDFCKKLTVQIIPRL